jgi:hypothetical protein
MWRSSTVRSQLQKGVTCSSSEPLNTCWGSDNREIQSAEEIPARELRGSPKRQRARFKVGVGWRPLLR